MKKIFTELLIEIKNNLAEMVSGWLAYHKKVKTKWIGKKTWPPGFTQVNRMSRSRRVLATGGKQRILELDMVCIETILFHLDSF